MPAKVEVYQMATPYLEYKPEKISEAAWAVICDGWENGLSDSEVAFLVSKRTGENFPFKDFKTLIQENESLADIREKLQKSLVADAKINVAGAIRDGDTATAKWLLERKAPKEFSAKASIALEEATVTLSIEDKEKALNDMINNFNGE